MFRIAVLAFLVASASAFAPKFAPRALRNVRANVEITKGVEFDTVAREWRMKWSGDDDKASLAKVQAIVDTTLGDLKGLDGVKSVQRVVCGGCLDYKIITSLEVDKFGAWEENGFEPESKFLKEVSEVPGITQVETQTFTLMSM